MGSDGDHSGHPFTLLRTDSETVLRNREGQDLLSDSEPDSWNESPIVRLGLIRQTSQT